MGKGLYLTKFGTQTYDYKADDPAPGSFKASLKDMELLIRALNLDIDGANHWSFTNRPRRTMVARGHLGSPMETMARRSRAASRRLFVLGLAICHLPQRAEVLDVAVKGGEVQGIARVWTAAVRSPRDASLTILVVNDAERPWMTRLAFPSPTSN